MEPRGLAARFSYLGQPLRLQRMSDDDAATYFGVSLDLLERRGRMTEINFQLAAMGRRRSP